jgi:hypothetical protein
MCNKSRAYVMPACPKAEGIEFPVNDLHVCNWYGKGCVDRGAKHTPFVQPFFFETECWRGKGFFYTLSGINGNSHHHAGVEIRE